MATITVSTNGVGLRPYGGGNIPECHRVEDVDYHRYCAGDDDRQLAVLTIDIHEALGIAYDLLYQAVDAGVITGWSVQHPEREVSREDVQEVFEDVRDAIA